MLRLLPLLALFCLAPAFADSFFPDVAPGGDARYIGDATVHQFIEGFPDGSFRPATTLTRAEGVMVLARFLRSALTGLLVLPGTPLGETRPPDNHWMSPAADYLADHGVSIRAAVQAPTAPLTRGAFLSTFDGVLHAGDARPAHEVARALAQDDLVPDAWVDDAALAAPLTRAETTRVLEKTLYHLTQCAEAEGTIAKFETDAAGRRWMVLNTAQGTGRLVLPERGVFVFGGTPEKLKPGVKIRTLSGAVPSDAGSYFRVREVTVLAE